MRGLSFMDVILAAPLAVEGLVRDVMSADEDIVAKAHFGFGREISKEADRQGQRRRQE